MPELGIPRENIVFISRHRLLEPLPVLHEHVRLPHDPRPRAGGRDRAQGRAARAAGLGHHRRRRRPLDRRQPPDPRLRRNVDLKIMLFNNRIYGLTKGQYSPTSRARQDDQEHADRLDRPSASTRCRVALGAEATFVARSIDVDIKHLRRWSSSGPPSTRARRSSRSTRTATSSTTARSITPPTRATKDDRRSSLEHGKPLIFGKDQEKGIRIDPRTLSLEVVDTRRERRHRDGHPRPRRDEPDHRDDARAHARPQYPVADGRPLCRRTPQLRGHPGRPGEARARTARQGSVEKLLHSGETWTV